MHRRMTFAFLLLICSTRIFAQSEDPKFADYLAAERALLPVDGDLIYDCARVSGYNGGTRLDVEEADVPFTKGYRVVVSKAGTNSWEPQFQTPKNTVPIKNGDMLYWVFYARTVDAQQETGQAKGIFYAQLAASPWTTITSFEISPGKTWTKYHVYAEVTSGYGVGDMGVTIHLGFFAQTVEFGGFIALNLGQNIDPKDLPANEISYVGREADASWRGPAAERIETHRKGDMKVHVVNGKGEQVKDAAVHVKMLEHAFHFGNFISGVILDNSSDAVHYETEMLGLFNAATTPFYMGDGGWGWYSGSQARQQYQDLASWLQDQKIHTKGHVLIWPGWQWLPPFIKALENDPEALRQALLTHLDEVVPIGRDLGLVEWDVMNEPYTNHDLMDILGEQEISAWYNRVHERHPEAKLILNETSVITAGGNQTVQDNLARIMELLQDSETPLHGIGFQGHFGSTLTAPSVLLNIFDRFAAYGLPLQITEFDVDIDDEHAQADYTRDFLTTVFSHPSFDKFIMWGFWETTQWRPRGSMMRSDWSAKANYHAYVDLIYKDWWTDETVHTDRTGAATVRGFLGSYQVTVSKDGEQVTETAELTKAGNSIQVILPNAASSVLDNNNNPATFGLGRNYPNPFNPATQISYEIPESGEVSLKILDVNGKEVRSLVSQEQRAGRHSVLFDGKDLSSGVYFARLSFNDNPARKIKMMLLK